MHFHHHQQTHADEEGSESDESESQSHLVIPFLIISIQNLDQAESLVQILIWKMLIQMIV